MAKRIQGVARGRQGKAKSKKIQKQMRETVKKASAATKIQKCLRGYIGRRGVMMMRQQEVMQLILGGERAKASEPL